MPFRPSLPSRPASAVSAKAGKIVAFGWSSSGLLKLVFVLSRLRALADTALIPGPTRGSVAEYGWGGLIGSSSDGFLEGLDCRRKSSMLSGNGCPTMQLEAELRWRAFFLVELICGLSMSPTDLFGMFRPWPVSTSFLTGVAWPDCRLLGGVPMKSSQGTQSRHRHFCETLITSASGCE